VQRGYLSGSDSPVILAGDALTVLYPRLADHSVDLLHTDVPYNLGSEAIGAMSDRPSGWRSVGAYDDIPYEPIAHFRRWKRILAPSGVAVIWCSDDQVSSFKKMAVDIMGADRADSLVWHVSNPTPVIRKSRLLSAAQFAVVARMPGPCRLADNWLGQGRESHNVWGGPKVAGQSAQKRKVANAPDGDDRVMGQKPQWLAVKVAKLFGLRGGLCVDPHSGTGALLVGAHTAGMHVIGAELRPWWAESGNDWLRNEQYSNLLARV